MDLMSIQSLAIQYDVSVQVMISAKARVDYSHHQAKKYYYDVGIYY